MLTLDKAFEQLLSNPALCKKIDVPENNIRQLRHRNKKGEIITEGTKRSYVLAAGYRPAYAESWYNPEEARRKSYAPPKFNRLEMIEFAKFFHRQSKPARSEPEYCLEKYLNSLK